MEILVVIDKAPSFNISVKKTTTIGSIKSLLNEKYQDYKIQMFLNNKTELKVFDSVKYDDMTLKSAWKQLKKPSIVLTSVYKKFLTGQKDADLLILFQLDDRTLLNTCLVDKDANKLCKDENFWMNRFINKFGKVAAEHKPEGRSWRNHYLKVISDLDKFSKNPWLFFDRIIWHLNLRDSDIESVAKNKENDYIKKDVEGYHNNFWMLNLGNKIKLGFPRDRYQELSNIQREYKSDTYFTPAKVLELVYNFYQEYITKEELEEQSDNPYAEEYDELDIGTVKRIDLMGNLIYFEGFGTGIPRGIYYLILGS